MLYNAMHIKLGMMAKFQATGETVSCRMQLFSLPGAIKNKHVTAMQQPFWNICKDVDSL